MKKTFLILTLVLSFSLMYSQDTLKIEISETERLVDKYSPIDVEMTTAIRKGWRAVSTQTKYKLGSPALRNAGFLGEKKFFEKHF